MIEVGGGNDEAGAVTILTTFQFERACEQKSKSMSSRSSVRASDRCCA